MNCWDDEKKSEVDCIWLYAVVCGKFGKQRNNDEFPSDLCASFLLSRTYATSQVLFRFEENRSATKNHQFLYRKRHISFYVLILTHVNFKFFYSSHRAVGRAGGTARRIARPICRTSNMPIILILIPN